MKILFITLTRIGDAILSTGLLRDCLNQYPTAKITVAAGWLSAPLFADYPNLDRILPLYNRPFSLHWYDLWKQTSSQSWDLTLDLRGSLMTFFLKSQKRYIWHTPKSKGHRCHQLAQIMGLSHVPAPYIPVAESRQTKMQKYFPQNKPVLALAPAANWPGKEWPLRSYQELIERLTSSGGLLPQASIAFFAAASERDRIAPLIQAFPSNQVIDMVGFSDLLDVAAALCNSTLFVGNDSGLMHLSAALGIPTVGLFGPSREDHYAPFGDTATYIRTPERYEVLMDRHRQDPQTPLMQNLKVSEVYNHINQFWYAKVCKI